MITKIIHDKFVYSRRMDMLSDIASMNLDDGEKILDIGCGDGKIDKLLMQKKDVDISGVDVLVREKTYIPVQKYDGKVLPYDNSTFDTVMFIDVLHHIENPIDILREAKRVVRKKIIIKDHLLKGAFAYSTLKFMDYIGNHHYGVNLPFNYLKEEEWNSCFSEVGLLVNGYLAKLHLYPFPFNLLFDRNLHFVANLIIAPAGSAVEG